MQLFHVSKNPLEIKTDHTCSHFPLPLSSTLSENTHSQNWENTQPQNWEKNTHSQNWEKIHTLKTESKVRTQKNVNSRQKMIPSKVKRRQLFLLLLILGGGLLAILNREPVSAVTPPPTFFDSSSLIQSQSQSSLVQSQPTLIQSQSSPTSSQFPTPLSETGLFKALMKSRIGRIGKQCEMLKLGWGHWLSNKTVDEQK